MVVKAKSSYQITDYYVSSEIEIAGGLKVKELIVLDGDFNDFTKKIEYKDSSLEQWEKGKIDFAKSSIYSGNTLDNLKVATFSVKDKVDFSTMNNISKYAQKGDKDNLGKSNIYTEKKTDNGEDITIVKSTKSGKTAFYLEYVITNVTVIHEDVAELYYKFINSTFTDDIDNVQIRVLLPFSDTTDSFRIWAHGPSSGELKKIQNEDKENIGVLATFKNLKANSQVDLRLTFDKSLIAIQNFLNHSEEKALPKILKVEEQRTKETKKQNNLVEGMQKSIFIMSTLYLIGLVILFLYIYLKYTKAYKSNFRGKYNQEFIEDYNVEVIDYLLHKKITSNAINASIMNLIYKKNIEINQLKKTKEYELTLKNKNNLTEAEKYLIELLFETIGENKKLNTSELKEYATQNKDLFQTKYETWQNKVLNEANKQNFFENKMKIKMIGILYFIISLIIFGVSIILHTNIMIAYIQIIPALIFLIYICTLNNRSIKGNNDYAKWQAFKNFLNDFASFDIKELPKTSLWDRYLVYATIFNLSSQVKKAMDTKIKELKKSNIKINNYDDLQNIINSILSYIIPTFVFPLEAKIPTF